MRECFGDGPERRQENLPYSNLASFLPVGIDTVGLLKSAFSPEILAYTYTTKNYPNSYKIPSTSTNAHAIIKVNGTIAPSGSETATSTLTLSNQLSGPGDSLITTTGIFVVPIYVTFISAMIVGGGGGGGSNADGLSGWYASAAGGGGGQGGVRLLTLKVVPGDILKVNIGLGCLPGGSSGVGIGVSGGAGGSGFVHIFWGN